MKKDDKKKGFFHFMNQPSKIFHLRENPDFEWLKEVKPKKVNFDMSMSHQAYKMLTDGLIVKQKKVANE